MDVDSDLKTDRFVREKPHNPDDIDVQYPDRIKTLQLIHAAILFPEMLTLLCKFNLFYELEVKIHFQIRDLTGEDEVV